MPMIDKNAVQQMLDEANDYGLIESQSAYEMMCVSGYHD